MTEHDESTDDAPRDVKQKFREALERKKAKAKAGEDHADATSKINHAHGPMGGQRQFRRKSG